MLAKAVPRQRPRGTRVVNLMASFLEREVRLASCRDKSRLGIPEVEIENGQRLLM